MAASETISHFHMLGHSATTLHTDQSSYIPVISDTTYNQRLLKRPWVSYFGARPIHRTTLTLDRNKPKTDYTTLYKHYFNGNSLLNGIKRPPSCPSMFTSQWNIGENRTTNFVTHSQTMFPPKTAESVGKMRDVQAMNRFSNSHGQQMMDVTDMDTGPTYYTSYRVSHDSLGKSRGNGVPHFRKQPPRFNVITGETKKSVETQNFRRRSGNRVLSEQRNLSRTYFQLG